MDIGNKNLMENPVKFKYLDCRNENLSDHNALVAEISIQPRSNSKFFPGL